MITPALTAARLRAQVQALTGKVPSGGVIAIQTPGPWTGPPSIRIGDREMRVVYCPSTLALREQLATSESADGKLILLTDRPATELGSDVLARLLKRRLIPVESWRVAMDLFGAHEVDPRLVRAGWMADALLEALPPDGYPKVATGVLDVETAWRVILCQRLGFADAQPDARGLVRWTVVPDAVSRFEQAPAEVQVGVVERLRETAGPAGSAIGHALVAGRGGDVFALGLVCRVLFAPDGSGEPRLHEARVRLEPMLGGHSVTPLEAIPWAEAAETLARDLTETDGARGVARWYERADVLLRELRIEDLAWLSPVLPSGFEGRLARFAGALRVVVEDRAAETKVAEAAASAVLEHEHARARGSRADAVRMSIRLARRLREPRPPVESLADAAQAYAMDAAFADWARGIVGEGDAQALVTEVARLLVERTTEERERENRRFGELLATWTAVGSSSEAVVPVESVLSQIVAPLAQHVPVLLVVLDGLSFPVFHELALDLASEGWMELGQGQPPRRGPAIAALPTITHVSRASLLAGRLQTGDAPAERQAFVACGALRQVSRSSAPPVLFHKADLLADAGVGLAEPVRTEIARATRQVVAVVINAIDDQLGRGDQLRPRWGLDAIRPLRWVLDAARDARRAVVITSDHGHVLERDMTYRANDTGGHRHRADDGAPDADEVALRGPRVLTPSGGVIAPWSERLRYGARQNGYHGGATPQEVVVPLAVFSAGLVPDGWGELAPPVPSWWEAADRAPLRPEVLVAPSPIEKEQGDLFVALPPAGPARPPVPAARPSPVVPTRPDWIERMVSSRVYESQKRLAGRANLPDERVRQCVLALHERGGKLTQAALARALGVPTVRIAGIVAALRRLLNVDGYPVVSVDESSDTVELNVQLLETQFGTRSD